MRRALAFALACAVVAACQTQRGEDGTGRGEMSSTSAGVDASASADTAPLRSSAALLEIFVEAAQTNLERPYSPRLPDSHQRYLEAAGALVNEDAGAPLQGRTTAGIVAEVLGQSTDERARTALMTWATNPAARPHVADILAAMRRNPQDAYLATCQAILADGELAREIVGPYRLAGGLLAEALWMRLRASAHVMAMELAVALPGQAGTEWVRGIAMDRAASAPDPRTLAALTCAEGEERVEMEAQALASRRIMALSTLGDRALLGRAADPNEPALVRHWSKRMLRGGPDLTRPGWESRLDSRQRRAYEHSMLEFVGRDVSPCLIVRPIPRFPERKVE